MYATGHGEGNAVIFFLQVWSYSAMPVYIKGRNIRVFLSVVADIVCIVCIKIKKKTPPFLRYDAILYRQPVDLEVSRSDFL